MTDIKINLSYEQFSANVAQALRNFQTNVDHALEAKGAGVAYVAGVISNLFFYGAEKCGSSPTHDGAALLSAFGAVASTGVQLAGLVDYASDKTPSPKGSSKYLANSILNLCLSVGSSAVGLPALKLLAFAPLFMAPEQGASKK